MHKNNLLFIPFISFLFLQSCNSDLAESKSVVTNFNKALNENNGDEVFKYFPEFYLIDNYLLSSNFKIINAERLDNDRIIVNTLSFITPGSGFKNSREINYLLKKNDNNEYIIYDTQGLYAFEHSEYYNYIQKNGLLTSKDTTDIAFSEIAYSTKYDVNLFVSSLTKFQNTRITDDFQIKISDYSGSASGSGIARNKGNVSYPNLKYRIDYFNSAGDTVTTDNGFVTYDEFLPGDRKSYTVYTSYVGNAISARIRYYVEDADARNYILNSEFYHRRIVEGIKKNRIHYKSDKAFKHSIQMENIILKKIEDLKNTN